MYGIGSGWMDNELFQAWFINHPLELVCTLKEATPLLLEGHSSPFNPDMIKMATKVFCLPLHTTTISQPLENMFSPVTNTGGSTMHADFAKEWLLAITPSNAVAGFNAIEISLSITMPLNCPKSQDAATPQPLKKGSITFLPEFSPSRSRAEQIRAVAVH